MGEGGQGVLCGFRMEPKKLMKLTVAHSIFPTNTRWTISESTVRLLTQVSVQYKLTEFDQIIEKKKNEYFRTRFVLFISRVGVFIVLLKSVKMERQQKRWYQMVLGRVKTAGIIWPLSRQITMKRMEFWNDFLRNFEKKIQIGKNKYVLKKRYCVNPL